MTAFGKSLSKESAEQRTLQLMMDGEERSSDSIISELDLGRDKSSFLSKLVKKGKLLKLKRGVYVMPEQWRGRHALRNG